MVAMLRSQPDAAAAVEPEPPLLRLPLGHLQPLPSPLAIVLGPMADHGSPLDPLGVHDPAGVAEHRRDPAVAVSAVSAGERDDVRRQRRLVGAAPRHLALRRAVLPKDAARAPLRRPQLRHDRLDATAAAGGAQKFPEAASRRISFSSVRSDTA
jgi:hypothetical protein